MASRPRKKRVTPRARASYETAMMLPLAAEGMISRPRLKTTRAAAGSAGRETTPEALAEPSPWKGLYCTTANGTPSSDESSPRSQAQSAWRGGGSGEPLRQVTVACVVALRVCGGAQKQSMSMSATTRESDGPLIVFRTTVAPRRREELPWEGGRKQGTLACFALQVLDLTETARSEVPFRCQDMQVSASSRIYVPLLRGL